MTSTLQRHQKNSKPPAPQIHIRLCILVGPRVDPGAVHLSQVSHDTIGNGPSELDNDRSSLICTVNHVNDMVRHRVFITVAMRSLRRPIIPPVVLCVPSLSSSTYVRKPYRYEFQAGAFTYGVQVYTRIYAVAEWRHLIRLTLCNIPSRVALVRHNWRLRISSEIPVSLCTRCSPFCSAHEHTHIDWMSTFHIHAPTYRTDQSFSYITHPRHVTG
jgi:hypothetical protein